MRNLFRITVIEHRTDKIVLREEVVAADQPQAMLKASLPVEVRDAPDKYEFVVESFSLKPRRDVQKVEVVTAT